MGNLNESGVERRRAKRLVKAFEAAYRLADAMLVARATQPAALVTDKG